MAPIPFSRVFPLIISSFPLASLAAGPPPVEWAKIVGQSVAYRPVTCFDVAADSKNNIYIGTGYNFGLAQYSPNGDFVTRTGIPLNDEMHSYGVRQVLITANDTVYSAGDSDYNAFSPWGQALNAYSGHRPIAIGPDGSSLFGVSYGGSNDMLYNGVTYSSTGYFDAAVFRSGPSGTWARRITGTSNDEYVDSMAMTSTGDALVSIGTASSSIGMAGLTLSGGTHYLVSLDGAGNAKWSKTLPSDSSAITRGKSRSIIKYDGSTDTLLWAADFMGTVNLGSSLSSSGGTDVVLARLSTSGNVLWAKKAGGGSGSQFASSVIVDRFGNIYLTGYFTGQLSIGTSSFTSNGLEDLYVAKFDKDGNPVWAFQIGSTASDMESGLALTSNDQLIVAGTIAGAVLIGGVSIEEGGPTDAFIAKFQSEGLPPAFSLQPKSSIVSGGAEIRLTAEVNSVLPVTYQWFFKDAPITGQTSSSLVIAAATPDNAGTYYLTAQSAAGQAKSDTVSVSYTDAAGLTLQMHPTLTIFGTVGQIYRIDGADITQIPFAWTTLTNLTLDHTPLPWVDLSSSMDRRVYRAVLQQ